MLQREVADRIVATPGSAEYGVLSVLVQWKASVTRLLALPPGAFRPPPAVKSALIRMTFRPPEVHVADPARFERLVRSVFTQRRKTLSNALAPFAQDFGLSAPDALRRRASTQRAGLRRCSLLKSLDLPTFSLRPPSELCYSFALSIRQRPAAWPRDARSQRRP